MSRWEKAVFFSVVIPTYNRKPILEKCLLALENQEFGDLVSGYEVILVDDGSTDGTLEWLAADSEMLPHLRSLSQSHQGPAAARNLGVEHAQGDTIVFIDSDLVVTKDFLQAHAEALTTAYQQSNCAFTYGSVINTCNFDHPTAEPYKITDFSAAYFATGNNVVKLSNRKGYDSFRFCNIPKFICTYLLSSVKICLSLVSQRLRF